jgi:Glycosyltransferase family 92
MYLAANYSVFAPVRQLRTNPPVSTLQPVRGIAEGAVASLKDEHFPQEKGRRESPFLRDEHALQRKIEGESSQGDSTRLKKSSAQLVPLPGDELVPKVVDETHDRVEANNPVLGTTKEEVKPAETVGREGDTSKETRQTTRDEKRPVTSAEYITDVDFVAHRKVVEAALKKDPDVLRRVISAYIEPPLHDTIPNTGDRGDMKDDKDPGTPPEFVIPLPMRTQAPSDLRKFEYPGVRTCNDMPGKFPVDRGLQIDPNTGAAVVWNVGDEATPPDFAEKEAPFCPVELDPFLPWIHDVFPSQDGTSIEFIAQNKRRCRTGTKDTENVDRLVPQVALMQSISVQRLTNEKAREMAPDLWHPDSSESVKTTPRYRLAPYEEASSDGMFTRFICRFHVTNVVGGAAVSIVVGETLSEYPFNYELVSYRKQQRALLSPKGKDTRLFWASNLHFSCPLPKDNVGLRNAVASGSTVLNDGSPTLFVDLVPIKTSVRYEELHLTESMIGPKDTWSTPAFDPLTRWGKNYVLPLVEASTRWTNIPICRPPELVDQVTVSEETELDTFESTKITRKLVPDVAQLPKKPHFLAACLWASAEFKTRGRSSGATTDTMKRLQEWIEFHLLAGFDHFYVYDNSGAHTNATTLEPVAALYPGKITLIDWPSTVCNNNIPAHDSTGERSSQYAAENSCRSRFGPFTEWMAAFDTDEYFVPMGNYSSLKDVLTDLGKRGTNIVSLRSSRGRLRMDKSVVAGPKGDALEQSPDSTFLEAYK